jgi:hypothetical protein
MLAVKPGARSIVRATTNSCGPLNHKLATHLRLVGVNKMSKRYILIRDRIPTPVGGFIEAFRMAMVELTSMGERHLDLTGYPHETETDALMSDWAALGADFTEAAAKIDPSRSGRELIDDLQSW